MEGEMEEALRKEREKRSRSREEEEEGGAICVTKKKGGKVFVVKKRNPIRIVVDIEERLKINWWVEAQESITRMASKFYTLCAHKEKVVRGVRNSFVLFVTTGLKASHHQFSSPPTYWSDMLHDQCVRGFFQK
jgi:hypothetical protein